MLSACVTSAASRRVSVVCLWLRHGGRYWTFSGSWSSKKSKHTSRHLLAFQAGHPRARQAFCARGRGRWLQCASFIWVWFWTTQAISRCLVPRPQLTEHWGEGGGEKKQHFSSKHVNDKTTNLEVWMCFPSICHDCFLKLGLGSKLCGFLPLRLWSVCPDWTGGVASGE